MTASCKANYIVGDPAARRTRLIDFIGLLNQISRLFDQPGDTDLFFHNAVDLITGAFRAEAGFLYLYDEDAGTLTRRAAAGEVRPGRADPPVGLRPGVVGQVFQSQESRRGNGADPSTPGGRDPEAAVIQADEENLPRSDLPAFLAVPVRRGPRRLGVLIIQRGGSESFSAEDDRALSAIGNTLAAAMENAVLLKEVPLPRLSQTKLPAQELPTRMGRAARVLYGRTASDGAVAGRAFVLEQGAFDEDLEPARAPASLDEALRCFDEAVENTRHQLEALQHETETDLSDVASLIFNSHLLMLGDESFTGEMRRLVGDGATPEHAVRDVVSYYAETFRRMEDSRFAEKVQDVQDVGHRLISNLQGSQESEADYSGYVVIARHAFPSELVKLAVQHVAGVVFHATGVTAHVAILSRSLGIPVLVVDDPSILTLRHGTTVLLDASQGKILIEPDAETQRRFQDRIGVAGQEDLDEEQREEGCTGCGEPVRIMANVNILQDLQSARKHRADGIGLYRSEFPFIIRNAAPTEEEQYYIYRRIIEGMAGRETVLRTADIGGDKLMDTAYQPEQNPFLGVRGIRFSLANTDLFQDQLRAMLRAGVDRKLRIMFPMVSSVEEVEAGRGEIEKAVQSLRQEDIPHNSAPKIGAMVELPSAVEAIAELAEATDFLSIGTNDLVMYLLAVDRTNERVGDLYRNYHPAVLRALKRIVDGVGEKLSELSLCGDSAADPTLLPFFIGIGIRKFSVAPRHVGKARRRIAGLTLLDAQRISREMLAIRGIHEMEAYLTSLAGTED